ncbi:MAG: hypothetical protein EOO22_08315 [Comamonadaceae bacterium]|nr:MAG: hypothetical protein EOO22_08315 [Comamonadaceae bacterium]
MHRRPAGKLTAAGKAICFRPPSEKERGDFSIEDYEPNPVDVWPENHAAVLLFRRLQTQWNYVGGGMGPSLEVGLHYPSLFALMDRMGLSSREYDDLFADIQVLEVAGLEAKREYL